MLVSNHHFVDRCLTEAIAAAKTDRRTWQRYPYFRPVTITAGGDQVFGFCRDVSRGGIGLLHSHRVEAGCSVTVKLPALGRHLLLATEIKWCAQVDGQLFSSASSFHDLSAGTSLTLVSAVFREEVNRRLQQRYAFFRSIVLAGRNGSEQPAYCRDISRGGIGLLHHRPITPGRTLMRMADAAGDEEVIAVDVRWCLPAGLDWYLSGARFSTVWLEEVPAKLL